MAFDPDIWRGVPDWYLNQIPGGSVPQGVSPGQRNRVLTNNVPIQGGSAAFLPNQTLGSQVGALAVERAGLRENRQRSIGAIGNQAARQRAMLTRGASTRVAQDEQRQGRPVNFAGAADQAVRRMRTRQGIVNRGEAAIQNQALKDRLRIVQSGLTQRGSLQNLQQQAINIREGTNVGIQDANNRARVAQANMWGSIVGSAARLGKQWWDNRGTNTQQQTGGDLTPEGAQTANPDNYTFTGMF